MDAQRYVFGPVPSRRLGRSLGVDPVPFKTCTYDCVYCQLGCTTNKTVERREYVPAEEVLAAVAHRIEEGARPDYVTVSGSGEPTLHAGIGQIIGGIKRLTELPVAVLTNGSLLWRDEVLEGLREADLIAPSLDAGDPKLFAAINRPHESLSFARMVEGLVKLRRRFRGRIWLEVFLLEGVNGTEAEVLKIKELAEKVQPDRVQLNTAIRPTAEKQARALPPPEMERLRRLWGEKAEVIADFREGRPAPSSPALGEDVLALLARRPCTLQEIVSALGLHPNEAARLAGELQRRNLIIKEERGGAGYYRARRPGEA